MRLRLIPWLPVVRLCGAFVLLAMIVSPWRPVQEAQAVDVVFHTGGCDYPNGGRARSGWTYTGVGFAATEAVGTCTWKYLWAYFYTGSNAVGTGCSWTTYDCWDYGSTSTDLINGLHNLCQAGGPCPDSYQYETWE